MRAFVDFFIDNMNEKADFNSKVVLVQPIAPIPGAFDLKDAINEQEGLYTLYLRGCENGEKVNKKRIISCVSRCLNAYTDFDAVMACAENPPAALYFLQYHRSRHHLRSRLPLRRPPRIKLPRKTHPIFIPQIPDFRQPARKRLPHSRLRADRRQRKGTGKMCLKIRIPMEPG